MKKILLALTLILFVISCTLQQETAQKIPAEDNNTQPEYVPVEDTPVETIPATTSPEVSETVEDTPLKLTVSTQSGIPLLTWSPFEGNFRNYVVLKSIVSATPDYPGEDSIKTIWKSDVTSYTDPDPDGGITYYRVIAVDNLMKIYKSNIVMSEMPDPKETPDQELNLRAEKNGTGYLLSWDEYTGDFKQYIVVSAIKHPYPKYPDDILEKTIPFVHVTSYVVYPKPGANYYAVSVIRSDKTKFTSNRVLVEV
ncbi:MAG: hypothetical protein ABIJ34_03690 [archaeon]